VTREQKTALVIAILTLALIIAVTVFRNGTAW